MYNYINISSHADLAHDAVGRHLDRLPAHRLLERARGKEALTLSCQCAAALLQIRQSEPNEVMNSVTHYAMKRNRSKNTPCQPRA